MEGNGMDFLYMCQEYARPKRDWAYYLRVLVIWSLTAPKRPSEKSKT